MCEAEEQTLESELVRLAVVRLDAAASVGEIFHLFPVYQCQPRSSEVMNAGKRATCRSQKNQEVPLVSVT